MKTSLRTFNWLEQLTTSTDKERYGKCRDPQHHWEDKPLYSEHHFRNGTWTLCAQGQSSELQEQEFTLAADCRVRQCEKSSTVSVTQSTKATKKKGSYQLASMKTDCTSRSSSPHTKTEPGVQAYKHFKLHHDAI